MAGAVGRKTENTVAGPAQLRTVGPVTWSDCIGVFLLGLAGTGHCLGMCGVFAVAVAEGSSSPLETVFRHGVYQFGKATSYLFVGLVLFLAARWAEGVLPYFRNALGVAVGLALVVTGISYAAELRFFRGRLGWLMNGGHCGLAGGFGLRASMWRSLLIGWINGLLPCGLSMMALLALVNTGSLAGLAEGVYVFGLATLPGLLVLALAGQKIGVRPRRWLIRLGGVALVAVGVLTLVRGVPAVHAWMHGHLMGGGQPQCERCR